MVLSEMKTVERSRARKLRREQGRSVKELARLLGVSKKRQNKLPYGTCRLKVCDTSLVQSIYGAIQEYAGFDREEWLM
jgi:transcriptional regulator with XRE-family HTH domain